MNSFSADKPISDPENDALGYAPFAKHLAESIQKMSPSEGLVVGVYGAWGSGKTTVMEFVIHYLKQLPEAQQPIIIKFNPWLFSNQKDLTFLFFNTLQNALGSRLKEHFKKVTTLVTKFAELVSVAPIPGSDIPYKLSQFFPDLNVNDLYAVKTELAKQLSQLDQRLIIVIDDIDRLASDEIINLFRVVKSVADFPNVTYILLFDKQVVAEALSKFQSDKTDGNAYLEKIIQVNFELPLVDQIRLDEMFFTKLSVLFNDLTNEQFDTYYWNDIYHNGLSSILDTPRKIHQLLNALSLNYPLVKNEVNQIDFIAIQSIRIFSPELYSLIRLNKHLFVGETVRETVDDPQGNLFAQFHETWIGRFPNFRQIVIKLFPKLDFLRRRYSQSGLASEWRRKLRICDSELFDVYFQLSVPNNLASNTEVEFFLENSNSIASLVRILKDMTDDKVGNVSHFRIFFNRLRDFRNDQRVLDNAQSLINAFFEVGDYLIKADERISIFDVGNEFRVFNFVNDVLEAKSKSERMQILQEAFHQPALATITNFIAVLSNDIGRFEAKAEDVESPQDLHSHFLDQDQIVDLEDIVLERIREATKNGSFWTHPKLKLIIDFWKFKTRPNEVYEYIVEALSEDDKNIVKLLEHYLGRIDVSNGRYSQIYYRLNPERLRDISDIEYLAEKIQSILEQYVDRLTDIQKIALEQFLTEYELIKNGEDPEVVMTRRRRFQ